MEIDYLTKKNTLRLQRKLTHSHRWTMELHYLLKKNTLPLKTKQTLIGGQWKYTISQRKASRKPEKKPAV